MHVTYFQRKPRGHSNYSVERVFDGVRRELSDRVTAAVCIAPRHSTGLLNRVQIAWHARHHQGDVNHVTGDTNFTALGLDGRRTILTNLDCGYITSSRGLRRWLLGLMWLQLPVRHVAAVTTLSGQMKAEIIRYSGCRSDKVNVVPVAVPEGFEPSRREFDVSCPRILHVGTTPNKNLPRLIEAVDGLKCRLVIIGPVDQESRQRLETLGIAYENRFNLSDGEMVREYQNCDLVAFASLYEGFGMPIVEGQAVGRPVVTSAREPMSEVAGGAACLVDPADVASIRSGLDRVIRDASYRAELIERGFENVHRFRQDRIAQQYLDLYAEVYAKAS